MIAADLKGLKNMDNSTKQEKKPTDMTNISARVPASIKQEFAEWCEQHGTNPNKVLRDYIRECISKDSSSPD